jgi:hypothetical protein
MKASQLTEDLHLETEIGILFHELAKICFANWVRFGFWHAPVLMNDGLLGKTEALGLGSRGRRRSFRDQLPEELRDCRLRSGRLAQRGFKFLTGGRKLKLSKVGQVLEVLLQCCKDIQHGASRDFYFEIAAEREAGKL